MKIDCTKVVSSSLLTGLFAYVVKRTDKICFFGWYTNTKVTTIAVHPGVKRKRKEAFLQSLLPLINAQIKHF